MFPSPIRPLAASVIITFIIIYMWLSGNAGSCVANVLGGSTGCKTTNAVVQEVCPGEGTLQPIPAKIWQIYFKHPRPQRVWKMMRGWEDKNPGYDHMVLDDDDSREFVK